MSGLSKTPSEDKDKKPSAENFELGRDNVVAQSIVDVSKISCLCSISKPTSPCSVDNLDVGGSQPTDEGIRSQCEENDTLNEQFDTSVRVNDECELGDDNLDSIKFESTDCLTYPESQESRTSGLERCVGTKGDGFSNFSVGVDLIKACSCSFCTKAAYIWSDLRYQDIKVRIAALTKSQKEVNILVQRSCCQGKSDILEFQSSLMGRWKSLFLHMGRTLGHESNKLISATLEPNYLHRYFCSSYKFMIGFHNQGS